MGEYLSIDEVSLSNGELYTFLTNKAGKGKKGTLVASIKGTLSKDIKEVLYKIDSSKRLAVKEVTMDMAKNMESAIKEVFPSAERVVDRFHVIKLLQESLQHIRIKYKKEALDVENEAIKNAKTMGTKYIPKEFINGDSLKQLLARSKYILVKRQDQWLKSQKERSVLLFENYPDLQTAYLKVHEFRNIYENKAKNEAEKMFKIWCEEILNNDKMKDFNTVANTVKNNLDNILNFFTNRNTNANAESFNSKIKLFRANLRGVTDTTFFLFRLHNLFA